VESPFFILIKGLAATDEIFLNFFMCKKKTIEFKTAHFPLFFVNALSSLSCICFELIPKFWTHQPSFSIPPKNLITISRLLYWLGLLLAFFFCGDFFILFAHILP
jgi:hypothetical protein